jgi:DNA-binding SARP family transcriptional activator
MVERRRVDLRVLGPIELVVAGRPTALTAPKERMLLALLVLADGRPVERDVLVDRIWGERAAPEATASLYTYVSHLRRVLEPGRAPGTPSSVLVLGPGGYALRVEPDQVDEHRFIAPVAAADKAMAGGDRGTGVVARGTVRRSAGSRACRRRARPSGGGA